MDMEKYMKKYKINENEAIRILKQIITGKNLTIM